jgi:signal transduction histidine kinase
VIRDITDRKQAEAALAAANRELERTNAELETLVYSASHDLKSPMVSLLGYLEYLKLDYGLFTNLIENAVRHGGRPDLSVTVEGRSRPDAGVELSVRDDGAGIPPEHRERVFGVFERLDAPSTAAGTGMGLAICRKVVELPGGSIAIHGAHGTDVRIVLPSSVAARWPPRS